MVSVDGLLRRAGLGLALALALLVGLTMSGPPAHAEGPDAVYAGVVLRGPDGALPMRVRAVTPDGAVCGTARVDQRDEYATYVLLVAGADEKPGCPGPGERIGFVVLYGAIDDGVGAHAYDRGERTASRYVRYEPDMTRVLHLFVAPGSR